MKKDLKKEQKNQVFGQNKNNFSISLPNSNSMVIFFR
jgi:hypothetical protein